jgi:hypothetical protein
MSGCLLVVSCRSIVCSFSTPLDRSRKQIGEFVDRCRVERL